ncbi:MAG TPA: hypothetical protein VFA13_03475, partial [Candidatus Acidoferrum sp.]|nr:hypothetical protein [Candidatus Acidoferrum sp.]
MPARDIAIVYRKELTEALRDRRTIITMVVVPLLLFPLLSVGFGSLVSVLLKKAQDERPKVMLRGGEDSPAVVAGLRKLDTITTVPFEPDWQTQIIDKKIPAAIDIPAGFQKSVAEQKQQTVMIYDYDGDVKSEIAKSKIEKYFSDYRDSVVKERLAAKDLGESVLKPFEVKTKNVAPPEKSGGALFFGGFIAYIVVFLCFNG